MQKIIKHIVTIYISIFQILFFALFGMQLYSQKTIINFNTDSQNPKFIYFSNGHLSKADYRFKIVEKDGFRCGEIIRAADCGNWMGIYTDLKSPVKTIEGRKFSIDVWMDHYGTFTLKLEGSYDGGTNVHVSVKNTKIKQWETLYFDFENLVYNTPSFYRLTLFTDIGSPAKGYDQTTYFKNMVQYPTGEFKKIYGDKNKAITIVVLGSSTAAGTGPKETKNAWVNRYRRYLQSQNGYNKVINLAVGGYTTYHLLPTGTIVDQEKPKPDPLHNITKAIELHPDAIIINLPSNDAAKGYSVQEQLKNYSLISKQARTHNIPLYISTPQGRNMEKSKRDIQIALKDSTFLIFKNKTLDFWTDIANPDGTIKSRYNCGDGIHLNDEGHKLLFEEVKSKQIDRLILNKRSGIQTIISDHVSPLSYAGYDLVWNDEFDSNNLNYKYWGYELGDGCPNLCGWGNNELVYYRPENIHFKNGKLIITANKDKFYSGKYSSSRINTKYKIYFRFGRIDIRAKLPKSKGLWPAFWLHGTDENAKSWPKCGEIDIMEETGIIPYRVTGAIHYSDNNNKHQLIYKKYELFENDFNDNFHIFSIIWDKEKLTWLVDDHIYQDIYFNSLNTDYNPFTGSFYLIINMAVGGTLPGNPDQNTVLPQDLIIDYIRYFKKR